MHSAWLGEFLGTMILILLGNGVVAGVLLNKSKAAASGWIVITAGWAFAVMAGVFTAIACGSSGAHLNPAVTLGFAVRGGGFQDVLLFMLVGRWMPETSSRSANFGRTPVGINSPSTSPFSLIPRLRKTKISCMVTTFPSMPVISAMLMTLRVPSLWRLT